MSSTLKHIQIMNHDSYPSCEQAQTEVVPKGPS